MPKIDLTIERESDIVFVEFGLCFSEISRINPNLVHYL